MYKALVSMYIPFLTIDHIKKFASEHHIEASEEEIKIVYAFIKEHYQDLMNDEETILLLKPLLRSDLYEQINSLYRENKAKYC